MPVSYARTSKPVQSSLQCISNTALYNVPYIKQIESHLHPNVFAPTTDLD